MRLLFKQRMFSWFASYDVFDENGYTVFSVEGQLDWGHRQHILDSEGHHIATVRQRIMTWLPKFEMFIGDDKVGEVHREFSLVPRYNIDFNGWQVRGDFPGWDYQITDQYGNLVASLSKELFHMTDHYVIDVLDPQDALCVLMLTIAIDADKSSNS